MKHWHSSVAAAFTGTSLAALVAVIAVNQSSAESSQQPKINKIQSAYECAGVYPSGDKYTLSLSVRQLGENYFFAWSEQGQRVQEGMGFRVENLLQVAFVDSSERNVAPGIVAYVVKNGELHGMWAVGDGKLYIEICTPPNSHRV